MNAFNKCVCRDEDETAGPSPKRSRIVADGKHKPTICRTGSYPLDLPDHLGFRRETGAHHDRLVFLIKGPCEEFRLKAMSRTCFTSSTGMICIEARTLFEISSRSLRFR